MTASGVLAILACSRTPVYAPLAKNPAAWLDGHFDHSLGYSDVVENNSSVKGNMRIL